MRTCSLPAENPGEPDIPLLDPHRVLGDGELPSRHLCAKGRALLGNIVLGAGTGLARLHKLGVLHCDFKAENVLLYRQDADTREGSEHWLVAKVSDLGLAMDGQWQPGGPLRGRPNEAPGTPTLLAPELADPESMNKTASSASDVAALSYFGMEVMGLSCRRRPKAERSSYSGCAAAHCACNKACLRALCVQRRWRACLVTSLAWSADRSRVGCRHDVEALLAGYSEAVRRLFTQCVSHDVATRPTAARFVRDLAAAMAADEAALSRKDYAP